MTDTLIRSVYGYNMAVSKYTDDYIKMLRNMKYLDYLTTGHWQLLRVAVHDQNDGACSVCGKRDEGSWSKFHTHHTTYVRKGHEKIDDMLYLCESCHAVRHDKIIECDEVDTFARLFESRTLSAAWIDLSASAKVLFMTCQQQVYAQRPKPNPANYQQFYMNQSLWMRKYHLYTGANKRGFYRDMTALIEHGFIVCIKNGASTRTKSVYEFSEAWKGFVA